MSKHEGGAKRCAQDVASRLFLALMRLLRRSYAYHAIGSRVAISIENRFVGQVTASAWVGDHAATRIVARQMAEMC